MSGLRTCELVILWFCRIGIGVWSFCIAFPLFCDQKGVYIVMYEGFIERYRGSLLVCVSTW